ncbi:metallophosphoesterase [Enterobacteriaceae bacterium H11S18]|uniref:metallophosphoesterase n=1 Tax=Dryocola clanedunensis TaxID=2925396 RepID=UPI0022F0365B|nr:metallophosphoesterase [Dryocola clanedunensis]MCT4710489.1 metallophosphoesterase [Dryocola clanedunensis]
MYQRIDGDGWRHIYIVGDLHGCLSKMVSQLKAHHFDPWQDLIISVGDVIDRGPDSPGCLALLDKRWFRAVRGNHEEMAVDALEQGDRMLWVMNGGDWFRGLSESCQARVSERLRHCSELPLIIELHTGRKTLVVAHADYPSSHYAWNKQVDKHRLVWSRERLNRHMQGKGENISGADEFYFGHTPLKEAAHYHNQHYIDTGAVFGNRLTLVQVQ